MGSATESDCHKDDSHYEYGNKAAQDTFDTCVKLTMVPAPVTAGAKCKNPTTQVANGCK
jgi:hypothetical protein